MRLFSIVVVWFVVTTSYFCEAADFYVAQTYFSAKSKESWMKIAIHDRVAFLLKESGTDVVMDGEIVVGDYEQLLAIHALVPIHTLRVSSPGGSVAEALKFIDFVNRFSVEVTTSGCRRDPEECICASACAFIWLASPVRGGHRIKVHRPYIENDNFSKLRDGEAMDKYTGATEPLRLLLLGRGYSQEFVNRIFRTPRERAILLSIDEISRLPIDAALDELVSARCYQGMEHDLARRHELLRIASEIKKEADSIAARLPDKTGYELENDRLHRDDFKKWRSLSNKVNELRGQAQKYDKLARDHQFCKTQERRKLSFRRSGEERLTTGARDVLRSLAGLLKNPEYFGTLAFIEKYMVGHEIGQNAREELLAFERELPLLITKLRTALPVVHFDYITKGLPQPRP